MELLAVDSDERWDALLEARADRSLYHTSAWLNFQARQFGYELHRLVARDGSRTVGMFPLFVVRRALFRVAASPRGVDYLNLGPLIDDERLGAMLDAYEDWARAHGVDFTSVAFMRQIDEEPARRRGYRCEEHLAAIGDLQGGEETMLARCKSSCRRAIRKAQRKGVKIVEGDIEPHLDLYLHLSEVTFAKSGIRSPLNRSVLSGMLQMLRDSGRLLSLRAELDGKVIGMYIVGFYGTTGYSLDIVADYAFSRSAPSNLLTWHAMCWCARHGLRTFDFGGARIASIAKFKTGFGSVVRPYTNITKAHSVPARAASWLKRATVERIRSIRRRRARRRKRRGEGKADQQS